jgi:hypothetical protein
MMFFLLLPLATKHWNLPLALNIRIFHTPSSWGLLSLPSFSFFFKENSDHLRFFFSDITFDLSLEKTCSYNFPWEERMISLRRWWKEGE